MRLIAHPVRARTNLSMISESGLTAHFLNWGGAKESVLLPRLEGRLVNASDDFSY